MRFRDRKSLRAITCPATFLLTISWWTVHPTEITFPLLCMCVVMWCGFLSGSRPIKYLLAIWFLTVFTLLPLEINSTHSLDRRRGSVPIVYGYPTDAAIQKAERGEIILGGCIIPNDLPWMILPNFVQTTIQYFR